MVMNMGCLVLQVEVWGLFNVITIAWDMGGHWLTMELDSKVAVHAVRDRDKDHRVNTPVHLI